MEGIGGRFAQRLDGGDAVGVRQRLRVRRPAGGPDLERPVRPLADGLANAHLDVVIGLDERLEREAPDRVPELDTRAHPLYSPPFVSTGDRPRLLSLPFRSIYRSNRVRK